MVYYSNRADDDPHQKTGACSWFGPGHNVHWIQARKALHDDVGIPVTVHLEAEGRVRLDDAGHERRYWHHDTAGLAEALALPCGDIMWHARFSVLMIETILDRRLFNLGQVEKAVECRA
ncbi:hypothetical protein ACMX2H_05790 [Arthrobacter sulfonylureivorans]|uniref:hypothetical protein n=1 Tax=Arthrobacter sulfonylureivorans TaxID=2486855 RepID=UPI0039E55367